jgi:PcfJ-like protein
VRRNRQKLHRELRLRAEAHKEHLRQRRRAREHERQRSQRALDHLRSPVRSAPAAPPSRLEVEWPGILRLLELADVPPNTIDKVHRLCRVLARSLPMMVAAECLPWLVLLSLPAWVRPIEHLAPPTGSTRRRREAVASHLLTRYPVPPFLLRALEVDPLPVARIPLEDRWAVEVLAHVGRGESLRKLAGSPMFPAPLTRQMCHGFLDATADTTPLAALRRAQVRGLGGPDVLATRLLSTSLADLHGPDPVVGEPYVQRIIGWLCRRPGLHYAPASELDDIVTWAIERNRQASPTRPGQPAVGFSLEGRTEASVAREVASWRIGRALAADPHDALPHAGVPRWSDGGWSVEQLCSRRALWEEGEAQQHCVAMYANLARRRKVAIYSLRWEGARLATIEVALGAGAVVQAKGCGNRALTPLEVGAVAAWAEFARYSFAR